MRITIEDINRCAVQLIDEALGSPAEYARQQDSEDHQRLLTLGFIRGVLEMSRVMKREMGQMEDE